MNNYTEMGAYTDQSIRAHQQARAARRLIIAQQQAKRQRRIETAKLVAEIIVGAFILYVLMFIACL